jgi:hypothetical protein
MAFRSVGDLAVEVLRNANLAARGHDAVHELGDEPVSKGVEPSSSRIAQAGRTASNSRMKRTGAETPASRGGINMKTPRQGYMLMHVKEPSPVARPVLRLIDCKGIGRASPTRRPSEALPSPLKLVWNGVQADTTFRAGAL